jgi:hypothetical protein
MQIVLMIHFVAQVKYNPYIDLRIDVVRPPNLIQPFTRASHCVFRRH